MKIMKTNWLWVIMGLLLSLPAFANEGNVRGVIADSKSNKGLEYVNVVIEKAGTKEFVTGTVTDEAGIFEIGNLAEGTYIVRFSSIGYTTLEKHISLVDSRALVDLRTLIMEEDEKLLAEVTVTGQRSQMRFEIDKRIFNVDQSLASAGGTASDVLGNIPSVEVDADGEVSLRGNSSVTVWINGRASGLTEDNRAQVLQQFPAESIERVEIITNPSAKYTPEGTAGIINIILKEDREAGYFGSVQANADTNGGYSGSFNIQYNDGKWETFAQLGMRSRVRKDEGYVNRNNLDENGNIISFLNQTETSRDRDYPFFARLGTAYNITPNDRIGVSLFGTYETENEEENIFYSGNIPGSFLSSSRLSDASNTMKMASVELSYERKINENSSFDFIVTGEFEGGEEDYTINQNSLYENDLKQTLFQHQINEEKEQNWEIQADYENKINETTRIEAGYKGEIASEHNILTTYAGATESSAVEDQLLFNDFKYDESVHAIYATFSKQINNLGIQAGLRGEYNYRNLKSLGWGDSESAAEVFKTDYLSLYPTVFLSYVLPNDNELQLNYTRRVSRPRAMMLNPFIDSTDSTNISFGNPNLQPQYSNALELNYIKNWADHTLSVSLYYRNTNDVIQRIRYMEDNLIKNTMENIAKTESAGAEFILKNNLFGNLDLTTSVNLHYNALDGFYYMPPGAAAPVIGEKESNFSWSGRMLASWLLPRNYLLQVTGNYSSRRLVAQGYDRPNGSMDIGLRKSFLNNKLSLTVSARDVFNSRKRNSVTSGAGFWQESNSSRQGRVVGFTLTYSFGNSQKNGKKAVDIIGSDDEE